MPVALVGDQHFGVVFPSTGTMRDQPDVRVVRIGGELSPNPVAQIRLGRVGTNECRLLSSDGMEITEAQYERIAAVGPHRSLPVQRSPTAHVKLGRPERLQVLNAILYVAERG